MINESKSLKVPLHYQFMYDLSSVLKAAFQENSALQNTWQTYPLAHWHQNNKNANASKETLNHDKNDIASEETVNHDKDEVKYYSIVKVEHEKNKLSKSAELLVEAAEFVVLEQLSHHLSEYFNNSESDESIKELSRKDIPHILLENRILNLLTSPFEDRAIFAKSKMTIPDDGELVSIRGSDGSMYQKFDLVLPIGTKVSRTENGSLLLDTKPITLAFRCSYESVSEVLPLYFEEGYLGVKSRSVDALKLNIEIETTIRIRALLSITNWRVFKWVDTFPDRLIQYADFSHFKENIGWNTAFTAFHISHAFRKAKKSSDN